MKKITCLRAIFSTRTFVLPTDTEDEDVDVVGGDSFDNGFFGEESEDESLAEKLSSLALRTPPPPPQKKVSILKEPKKTPKKPETTASTALFSLDISYPFFAMSFSRTTKIVAVSTCWCTQ